MKSKLCKAIIAMLGFSFMASQVNAACVGKFANPITDVCWSCMFPFYIMGMKIDNLRGEQPAGAFTAPAVCAGQTVMGFKIGVGMDFYDPNKIVDVTRTPYCMVGLGGVDLSAGVASLYKRQGETMPEGVKLNNFYQAHTYINPLLFILEVPIDMACTQAANFDIAYLTELDPLWNNDNLTFFLNPDAILYANPATAITTALDCVNNLPGAWNISSGYVYWSAGCQGSMFPLDGNLPGSNPIDDSVLTMQRLLHKNHRELLEYSTAGPLAVFAPIIPQPIMNKTEYKYSMIYPVNFVDPLSGGKCCSPFGRTTAGWAPGHSFPTMGEDFSYQIYQRRDCCSGITIPN